MSRLAASRCRKRVRAWLYKPSLITRGARSTSGIRLRSLKLHGQRAMDARLLDEDPYADGPLQQDGRHWMWAGDADGSSEPGVRRAGAGRGQAAESSRAAPWGAATYTGCK